MSKAKDCDNIEQDPQVQKELRGRFFSQMSFMIVYLITSIILLSYIWAKKKQLNIKALIRLQIGFLLLAAISDVIRSVWMLATG